MPSDRGITRRLFFTTGGALSATLGVGACSPRSAPAPAPPERDPGAAILPYPRQLLGRASALAENQPLLFDYPDDASPCFLVKNGRPVPGGVGPGRDVVAYSNMCVHMGCPVAYDPEARVARCGCHFTIYDAERAGQVVCGQATASLPQIVLEHDEKTDEVRAVGVRGLLYGRQSNLV
jgi:arsenite oxidase small subunit